MPEARILDPATTFRFEVHARNSNIGFSKVSGLRDETEVIEYREGSDQNLFKRKLPGLRTAPNVVCERGVGPGREMIAWRNDVIQCKDYRSAIVITIKNCDGSVARKVKFDRAWLVALQLSDLDGASSEVAIETMEFVHEGQINTTVFSMS